MAAEQKVAYCLSNGAIFNDPEPVLELTGGSGGFNPPSSID